MIEGIRLSKSNPYQISFNIIADIQEGVTGICVLFRWSSICSSFFSSAKTRWFIGRATGLDRLWILHRKWVQIRLWTTKANVRMWPTAKVDIWMWATTYKSNTNSSATKIFRIINKQRIPMLDCGVEISDFLSSVCAPDDWFKNCSARWSAE